MFHGLLLKKHKYSWFHYNSLHTATFLVGGVFAFYIFNFFMLTLCLFGKNMYCIMRTKFFKLILRAKKCVLRAKKCVLLFVCNFIVIFSWSITEHIILRHMVGGTTCVPHMVKFVPHAVRPFPATQIPRSDASLLPAPGPMAESWRSTRACTV